MKARITCLFSRRIAAWPDESGVSKYSDVRVIVLIELNLIH